MYQILYQSLHNSTGPPALPKRSPDTYVSQIWQRRVHPSSTYSETVLVTSGQVQKVEHEYFSALTGCLPLFFFGFCERGQILSGIAKSRIWRAFLSFCALILFEPFSLLFGILGSACAKWYFVPTRKWSMVAAQWQRDGGGKCGGSAVAAWRR